MDVDSGCGSSSQAEEYLPPIEVAGDKDSKALASAPNFGSSDMVVGPFAKFRDAITIIEQIQKLISDADTVWNKQQCKRIAYRCNFLAEILTRMVQDGNAVVGQASDGGCSSGEEVDGLLHELQKVKIFISGYVNEAEAITNVVFRANNPAAFKKLHEELDAAMAKLGLLGMADAAQLTYGVEPKLNMLRADAEEDKEEMLKWLSEKSAQSAGMNHTEKLAQVVKDRVEKKPDKLPSYLKISETEIILVKRIREYERNSDRDSEQELGWAEVWRGKWLNYCDVAIKVFKCGANDDHRRTAWNQEQLLMEAGSLVELNHPHVVQLVGFGQYAEKSVFVMECMDGDLRNFMKDKLKSKPKPAKPFTDSEELEIIMQIAQGLYFIHTRGYAHGDLKCSNIVVNGNRGQYLEVKIADLRGSQKCGQWNPEAFKQASKTRRPRWTAPEALDGWDYEHNPNKEPSWEFLTRMDIYSFGMTCYEIVTGKYPFDGLRDEVALVKKIKEGGRPKLPENLDERLGGLITSCWDKDPTKRPSFESIFQFLDYCKSLQKDRSSEVILAVMRKQFRMLTWWRHQEKEQSEPSQPTPKSAMSGRPEYLGAFPEYRYLKIEPEELKRVERIGSGASARVYKIIWLTCTFAEKELKKRFSNAEFVQQEIEALIKVSRHPCMVRLMGLSVKPDGVRSIVMEYMDGNLRELMNTRLKWISGKGPFDFHEELQIISKIALGMAYLHSRNVVHRDLKSGNVLAREHPGMIIVKIVDFGMSHLEESLESSDTESLFTESSDAESSGAESTQGPIHSYTRNRHSYYSGCGTGFYRAPEMLPFDPPEGEGEGECLSELGLPVKGSEADLPGLKATDVFSFAMLCYEVLTGNRPCSDLNKKDYAAIRKGRRPTWPRSPNAEPESRKELKRLIAKCWETRPQDRPTFDDICKELLEI